MHLFLLALLFFPTLALAQFSIDSPLPGSVQSGTVAPPVGWRCTAGEITASLNNGPTINFTERQNRGDTAGPCSNNGDNAFIIAQPWNWNLFGDGLHTIEFFDNGVSFASITFEIATFGTEFLFGPSASFTVQDFPDPGGDVEVSWDAAIQNFRITRVIEDGMSAFPNVAGSYTGELEYFRDDCLSVGPSDFPGTLSVDFVVTQDGENITIVSGVTTFVGTVEMDGDFTAIDTDPSTATAGTCQFSTGGGYGGNFLTGLFVLVLVQSPISGSCALLGLPCSVDFVGTLAAKGWADENVWEPSMLVDIIEQATIAAAEK